VEVSAYPASGRSGVDCHCYQQYKQDSKQKLHNTALICPVNSIIYYFIFIYMKARIYYFSENIHMANDLGG